MNRNNIDNFNNIISSYCRKLICFDHTIINKILNIMFCESPELLENIIIDSDDVVIFNDVITFLSAYDGNDILNDFFNLMNTFKHKYINEFYIYFLQLYNNLNYDGLLFNLKFKINIRDLFYFSDAEAFFNKNKFRKHFRKASMYGISIDEDIDSDIYDYISSNLPSNIDNDLERAIAIYYFLCKLLRYEPNYIVYKDLDNTLDYDDVSLKNNRVVCVQFSIIYYKLLKKYNIDAALAGNVDNHMFVNLRIGTMMITADGTRYGNFTEEFNISDLTATKYNFIIDGFYINGVFYSDLDYVNYNREKLSNAILTFYKKIGIRNDLRKKYDRLILKFRDKEFEKNAVFEEDIKRRMDFLNSIYYLTNNTVEDVQMLTKLVVNLFSDILDERTEQITLYRVVNKQIVLTRLLVFYDENMKPYYYFYNNGKYRNYEVDMIVKLILENGWIFKHQMDIEALSLDDEQTILKLMR